MGGKRLLMAVALDPDVGVRLAGCLVSTYVRVSGSFARTCSMTSLASSRNSCSFSGLNVIVMIWVTMSLSASVVALPTSV